jgi:hypothetical protein
MKAIRDKFSKLPISRQRKYQLRRAREGKCEICGDPAAKGFARCPKCHVKARERQRHLRGHKRRWLNARSYRLLK